MNDGLSEYLRRRNVLVNDEVYNSMSGKYGKAELEAALMVMARRIEKKIALTDPADSSETPVHITPKMIDNFFSR